MIDYFFTSIPVLGFCLYLHLWGMLEDGYNGRGPETQWLFSHVLNWSIRDWIIVALYTFLLKTAVLTLSSIDAVLFVCVIAVMVGVHAYTSRWAYMIGELLQEVIKPDDRRPHWLVWRLVQLIPGIVFGYLFL